MFNKKKTKMAAVTVKITSNDSWTIEKPADATWITLDKTSGNGSGTFSVTCAAQALASSRNTTLTIKTAGNVSKTLPITQDGAASTLTISPTSLAFDAAGNQKT